MAAVRAQDFPILEVHVVEDQPTVKLAAGVEGEFRFQQAARGQWWC